ncbi:MAG: ABC transporter ATP-binding protein [Gammaproteobacteria bacterium]|nr:ABC transporter ATP-binding protein [Gammaproteobacteria bacterium]
MVNNATDLRLVGVSKRYRDAGRPVLTNLDLEIAAGDYVVVIGRSGSGKSTLLNIMGGLDLPSTGEVWCGDRDLVRLSETERAAYRRRDLGFVFQAFNLVPTLTVLENLRVPAELNRLPRQTALQRCQQLLEDAGLSDCARRFPAELSGGEQQRVAILRAVVHEPSILIADEPTGNLDLETARRSLALLEQHGQQEGRTLIMATHSPEVMGRARRVLAIRDGHLEPADSDELVP